MANRRTERLTSSGLEPAQRQRGVRWPWVAGIVGAVVLGLAWFDGGEEALHPIAQDVALPEQSR
ncbi:MAG: hypothetical protein KAF27_08190 [Porphyrobacter sp.]|nr:hypothetical protein [Porphyrobacter sp.]